MVQTQLDMRSEIGRRKSQSQRLLELLRERPNGQLTNIDLQKIAFNYTMRVSELRKEGHGIVSEYWKPGVYRYFYQGRNEEQ